MINRIKESFKELPGYLPIKISQKCSKCGKECNVLYDDMCLKHKKEQVSKESQKQ